MRSVRVANKKNPHAATADKLSHRQYRFFKSKTIGRMTRSHPITRHPTAPAIEEPIKVSGMLLILNSGSSINSPITIWMPNAHPPAREDAA
jgi:hypothetical protein